MLCLLNIFYNHSGIWICSSHNIIGYVELMSLYYYRIDSPYHGWWNVATNYLIILACTTIEGQWPIQHIIVKEQCIGFFVLIFIKSGSFIAVEACHMKCNILIPKKSGFMIVKPLSIKEER